ncbi:hypothetical protein ACE6H2_009912 [Prunus campanulata]
MSSTATSSGKVKGGRGQNKRYWTTKEDNTLMECLMELHQNTNWRGDSGFKNGYLNKLETMLEVKLPNSGLKASPHIESRVKTLKGKYGALADALSQSGFGWNEEEMMLVCEKSVFDAWAKNKKDASGLYGKSFPHYYALGEIYGKDRAIGTNAGNADDDEEDVRRDDASVHKNRSVGDDFIEEMFSHPDGGSQYGGSDYEGSQFEDVEDLEDDETTFTQPNPQPSSAQQRAQQKRPAQDVASGPNNPRRKVNALNEMSNKFGLMAEAVAGMAPQLAGLVNVLSTEKDLADMQANLGGELRKIEFLSPLQVFRITNILAKEHDLLRVFFTMTDEEKKDYVFNLMEHGLQ